MSRTLNLPPSWHRMSWRNKAGYLKASNHARTFEEACSMLRTMSRPGPKPSETTPRKRPEDLRWDLRNEA